MNYEIRVTRCRMRLPSCAHPQHTYLHATQTCRPIISLVWDKFTFFFFLCGFGCKEIHSVVKLVQKNNKMGTSLRWTICNAEKRQCADLFLEVSDPRAAHMAVCSDAQLSMQYAFGESYKGLYSFQPVLPVHSPSLAVPSSYCSSYGNIKETEIQDWQTRGKKHVQKRFVYHYWQEIMGVMLAR